VVWGLGASRLTFHRAWVDLCSLCALIFPLNKPRYALRGRDLGVIPFSRRRLGAGRDKSL